MTEKIVSSRYYHKIGEILIPVCTWILITMPVWLSPFHPAVVAYFIIAFDLYFLYKSLTTAYFATLSYRRILFYTDIPFAKKLQSHKHAGEVNHFIIIPNYKEPIYKLETTVEAITKSDYPYKRMHLVLAFEKREQEADEKAQALIRKFGHYFRDVILSYHVLLPHEAAGKASNQTHAAKEVYAYAEKHGMDPKSTIITICDADSLIAPNYFSYLTSEFLKDRDRLYHFYWAPVLLYNNFWQLPFFVRMQATLSSILRLAFLSQIEHLIHISTYSTNLWLLHSVDYWDVDIIPEDWHI